MSGPPLGTAPDIVAKYTSTNPDGLKPSSEVIEVLDDVSPEPQAALQNPGSIASTQQLATPAVMPNPTPATAADFQAASVASFQSDFVKQFQTNFSAGADPQTKKQSKLVPKQALFNRTSISSLMNTEESVQATKLQEKKRKTTAKDTTNKKAKTEPKKEPVAALGKTKDITFTSVLAPEPPKKEKKVAKKKTPETTVLKEKLAINPTVTTNKQKAPAGPVNLPNPTFLEVPETGNKDAEAKEAESPVIFLDIPLLDPANPKPGQAEVVINVLKLAEDKYGWNAVHPDARSAIDIMDDILDEDDDGDDDDGDDDLQIIEDKSKNPKENEAKGDSKDEEEKSRKWRAQQTKINRKVGKYDYEDPFIDDAELQWEEEITTTKEGFFVYWGPLVDERSSSAKKGQAKPKK